MIIMSKVMITTEWCRCDRCFHTWQKRGIGEPIVCPNCKSPYWNTPPKKKRSVNLPKLFGSN
jgi:hypothetical protein